jgi:hypothetical protein
MAEEQQKRSTVLKALAVGLWLLVGPYICLMLIASMFPDRSEASLLFYPPAWVATAIAALAIYFLPLPLWQRVYAFIVYVPIVSLILPVASLFVACFLFHDCL